MVDGISGDKQYATNGNYNVRLCSLETAPEPPAPEENTHDLENDSENIPPRAEVEHSEEERRAENVLLENTTHVLCNVLKEKVYDVIMVTTGIRLPPEDLRLFERIVSVLIDESAPHAQIVFNSTVSSTRSTIERCLEPEEVYE